MVISPSEKLDLVELSPRPVAWNFTGFVIRQPPAWNDGEQRHAREDEDADLECAQASLRIDEHGLGDLLARDQNPPLLFQLKALTRTLEDTHLALGIDLFNGTRALYKAVKPIALINGVQDIINRIGQRFARQKRTTTEPAPVSMDSNGL